MAPEDAAAGEVRLLDNLNPSGTPDGYLCEASSDKKGFKRRLAGAVAARRRARTVGTLGVRETRKLRPCDAEVWGYEAGVRHVVVGRCQTTPTFQRQTGLCRLGWLEMRTPVLGLSPGRT